MGTKEEEGNELVMQAKKKLTSSGFFSMFSGGSKEQDAIDLYTRAGNCYKMDKCWKQVGDCFMEVGKLQGGMSQTQAATHYKDAALAYKKVDPNAALDAYGQAITLLTDCGRFREAARRQMDIGQIYEEQLVDIPKAVDAYQIAAEWFDSDGESSTDERKALIKVAMFSAQLEQYDRAIELFEKIGSKDCDNKLLKFGAKDFFFKACLCHCCTQDTLTAKRALEQYQDQCPGFARSREAKLIENIIEALEEEDLDKFVEHVQEHDSMSTLDPWITTIMLRIKEELNDSNVT